MMPEVNVEEITASQVNTIKQTAAQGPHLGGQNSSDARVIEQCVNKVLNALRDSSKRVFRLTWNGNKIPHGARILNHEVGWTQNGMVTSKAKESIGTYDRVVEFGGKDGMGQEMIVYLFKQK